MHYLAAQSTHFVYILTFLQKLCLQFMKRLAITCWNSMIFAFCIYTNFFLIWHEIKTFSIFYPLIISLDMQRMSSSSECCRVLASVQEKCPHVSGVTVNTLPHIINAQCKDVSGERCEDWVSRVMTITPVCSLLRTNNKSRMWIINRLSGCPLQPRLPHPLLLLQDSLQVLLLDSRLFLV